MTYAFGLFSEGIFFCSCALRAFVLNCGKMLFYPEMKNEKIWFDCVCYGFDDGF